jgi:hypothetical protein
MMLHKRLESLDLWTSLSSGILNTRKRNVSETESVFIFRRAEGNNLLGPLERHNLNAHPHLKTGTSPVS